MKKQSIPSLKKKAEIIFHRYIRLRDCLTTTGTLNRCHCITCGKSYPFETIQAGHFYHNGADFDERNLHGQCVHCNKYLHGNAIEYYPKMLSIYGQEVIDELAQMKRQPQKFTVEQLEKIIAETKEAIVYIEKL